MSGMFEELKERLENQSEKSEMKCEEQFIRKIKKGIMGFNAKIQTVIGDLCGVYCDHTATARPFRAIEEHVMFDIKPLIANSHTETSATGNFSTQLMQYSEESLLSSFKVSKKSHFAIAAGYGCTGAFERMINILSIPLSSKGLLQPVVFITPYEHHSNILPWVERGCKVIMLESDRFGNINYQAFRSQLSAHIQHSLLIVSISAASNVTSQITDLPQINSILQQHRLKITNPSTHKVIFAVDGAAYCSHGRLDLKQTLEQLDYLCLSPHKNLGGSESCGVLIGKKASYDSAKPPSFPGGGTVLAVVGTDLKQIYYDSEPSHRESPGTPNTIGFYRAALSFQLQDFLTLQLIHDREKHNAAYFAQEIIKFNTFLQDTPTLNHLGIEIYGENNFDKRFGVFSFNIFCKSSQHSSEGNVDCYMTDPTSGEDFLHPHYGAKLLNDYFAIQVRSGCSCAGPFGVKLLDIPQQTVDQLAHKVAVDGRENLKPGWIRLDTNFVFEKYELDYILQALFIITLNAQNLTSFYSQSFENGQFTLKCGFKPKYEFGISKVMGEKSYLEYKFSNRQQMLKSQIEQAKLIFKSPQEYFYNAKIATMKKEHSSIKNIFKKNKITKNSNDKTTSKDMNEDDGFVSLDEDNNASKLSDVMSIKRLSEPYKKEQITKRLSEPYKNEQTKTQLEDVKDSYVNFRKSSRNVLLPTPTSTDSSVKLTEIFKYSELSKQYIKPEILSQIDVNNKEMHLSNAEFFEVFKMNKNQYQLIHNVQQNELKTIYSLL